MKGKSIVIGILTLASCADAPPARPVVPRPVASVTVNPSTLRGVEKIVDHAKRLEGIVSTSMAKQFLSRASLLPKIAPRKLFVREDKSKYFTEAEALAESPEARAALKAYDVDEEKYYNTNYGSPLSYSRPLDILFSRGLALPAGAKVLDFGYGYVGHLRLLATLGIHTTGVDVWPLLPALYSFPGDQGEVKGPQGETGTIRLIDGRFPADSAIVSAVGNGYNLIISKNVLKRGYIHPERPVADPKRLINLGVTDEIALRAFHDALAPGGYFLIYNICPALTPPDKPFVPWSDGRSPFTKAQIEATGFEVIEFDKDDTDAVRVMAKALGWDQPEDGEPGMDLVNDLSVLYTLMRKPLKR